MVTTSVNKTEILQLLPTLIGYSIDDTVGFPSSFKFANVKGSVIVPTDLESNVVELHKFLYGDEAYTPSATVKENSQEILDIVGGADNLNDVQPVVTEETENDAFFYQNDGSGWSETQVSADDSGDYGDYDNSGTDDGGYTDPGTDDGGYTDPGTDDGGYTDPGTDDGGYTDPGTDGGDYTDPGTGGGDYTDPGTGGGDYTDPGTGGGDTVDSGGDTGYVEEGGGDAGGSAESAPASDPAETV